MSMPKWMKQGQGLNNSRTRDEFKHVAPIHQENVLGVILDHIGKPAPTNGEISKALGMKRDFVSSALTALVARKIISRSRGNGERTFTINETDQSTLPGPSRETGLHPRIIDQDVARDKTEPSRAATPMYRDAVIIRTLRPL